jgi:ribosomal protein S27AE
MSELAFERIRAKAGPCPRCGATAAKPILWGYPTAEDFDRLGDRVGFGGCVIPPMPAAYVCGECGHEYGVARGFE